MNRLALAITSLLASGSFVVVAVARWQAARPNESHRAVSVSPARPPADSMVDDSLASAEESIVSNDPFRIANSPSAVRYDPASESVQSNGSTPPILVRPSFVLRAIVGGPPWQAVIDGFPGQPAGAIVRTGTTLDKLTVSAISRDSVIIKGPDTSWTLSFRAHR